MADEVERTFGRRPAGAWLAERVWEPDAPDLTGRRRLRLDDPRRRALPRRRHRRGRPVGRLHHRRPGPAHHGSSAPSRDSATASRSARWTRSSATCASTPREDGERIGTMGDDGEKFGAWPTTWDHCWGTRRWVDRFFEALEENADWLTTITPSDWLAAHPPIGRVYVPDRLVRRDGRVGAAARREPGLRRSPPSRAGRGATRRRAGCAAPRGATSRSATARSTTCTSRCCGRPTRWTRMPTGPERERARPTTSTRASRTTATGTACSAASTSRTCAWRRSPT